MLARHGTGKTQPAFAEDTLLRIGAQEAPHQHRKLGPFWFFPYRHRQRVVDLRQQRAPFAVGQKTVVLHHFKIPRRNMADVMLQHLLLADSLAIVLLRAVVVILMHYGTAAVVPQLRSCHRRALQVPAQVFHAAPGAASLFGKMHLPGAAILGMQIMVPPIFVTDMTEARQAAGVNLCVVVAQQINDGVMPDLLYVYLFKEQLPPDVVLDVGAAAGNGDVDMRVLIELPAVGVERTEDTDFDLLLTRPAEHGAGDAAEQVVEQ